MILDIFYNEIIKEAQIGRVEADGIYNVIFNTFIPEINIDAKAIIKNEKLLIPTLFIQNKKAFDELLELYVNIALKFYDESNYLMDYVNGEETKTKTILTLLWSNATIEDFNNPITFLKRRIKYFENKLNEISNYNIGSSETLGCNIIIDNIKTNIKNETPYALKITLTNGIEKYELPLIYYGIYNNEVYIYAIQNNKKFNTENNKFQKFIKRKLYSLDDGIDVKSETYENYGVGNIKDITHSFLLALNIALSIFKSIGIDKVIVPSILITRWNSKEIMLDKKGNIDEYYHDNIQSNLTEKLIRTFIRLSNQNKNIEINSLPSEIDYNLILNINENEDIDNKLLKETYLIKQKNNSLR